MSERGDIGLGLVIIVIADEEFDRIVGEVALELAVELRGEDLVGRHHQRRPLQRLDDLGHGEGLARAGDAEQHLALLAVERLLGQFLDRRRLVAGRLVIRDELERLAALRLLRTRRLVRDEGLARFRLGKRGADLNRHRRAHMVERGQAGATRPPNRGVTMMRRAILLLSLAVPLAACGSKPRGRREECKRRGGRAEGRARRSSDEGFVQPGKWQSTVKIDKMDMPGMPPEVRAQMKEMMARGHTPVENCLTPEEVKQPKEDFFAGNENCRYDHFTMGGGKIDAEMHCDRGRDASHANGRHLFAEELPMHMSTMRRAGGRKGMSMKMSVDASGSANARARSPDALARAEGAGQHVLINRGGGSVGDPKIAGKERKALEGGRDRRRRSVARRLRSEVRGTRNCKRGDELVIVGGGDGTISCRGRSGRGREDPARHIAARHA